MDSYSEIIFWPVCYFNFFPSSSGEGTLGLTRGTLFDPGLTNGASVLKGTPLVLYLNCPSSPSS